MAVPGRAQTALVQTTLGSLITQGQNTFTLGSVTGITAGTIGVSTDLYVDRELMIVLSVNTTTKVVTVSRGQGGTQASGHANSAMVLYGPPNAFQVFDPEGACVTANTAYTPWVNVRNGYQWLCSTVTLSWVAGFNNLGSLQVTKAVASAAADVLPTGPLFHITGTTTGITGFTIPVGFEKGKICAISDSGTWTTTTGSGANNFAIGVTGTQYLTFCWTYDKVTGSSTRIR